jgi:DNA-nicking Smr family endonuclease
MARKKRRGRSSKKKLDKGKGPFNPVLNGLEKKEQGITQEGIVTYDFPHHDLEQEDNQFFFEAMADVRPLYKKQRIVTRVPNPELKPAHPIKNSEQEVVEHLSGLVNGTADMDITFSDEYIEGSVPGLSRKLMRRLKKGQFPIQDHIDLHGLTKGEAEVRIRDFLIQSYRLGLGCVLVVHGRGLNSENNIPVLKERLPIWLSKGPAKKIVLGFSTAKPYDGGTGAIYVLLRRPKIGI